MVELIVKLTSVKEFAQIDELTEQVNWVTDINKASVFEPTMGDTVAYYLDKIRTTHPGKYVVADINPILLNEPIKYRIQKEKEGSI